MFTGLIQEVVSVIEGAPSLKVTRPKTFLDLKAGESIAFDGVCLTLTEFCESSMDFFVGQETLSKTTFGSLTSGAFMNAERSLSFGDRLGGHLVSGHVDGVGEVVEAIPKDNCLGLEVKLAPEICAYPKGSIAINGVSLTVNRVDLKKNQISVFLIPETLQRTNLKTLKKGDKVNIEYDQIAKIISTQVKLQLSNREQINEYNP